MGVAKSIRITLALGASALAVVAQAAPAQPVKPAAPNIVFILADDLGYGQIGVDGQKQIKTPNIDRMAAEGMQFAQAYAGGPVCSPSRVSLLTGRDARIMRGNNNGAELTRDDGTLPELLDHAGYETALFGKWGVGTRFGTNDPMTLGFSTWFGFLENVEAHRQYPTHLFRDNALTLIDPNVGGAHGVYAQRLFTDEAVKFIAKPHAKPYFLYLAYTTPHAELAAPANYMAKYHGKFAETPYLGMTGNGPKSSFARFYPEPVAEPNATMAAMVTALDAYVGEVLAAVEKSGQAKNTIVIFTSDNGPHEEGGIDPAYFHSSAPFRGIKRDLYDGGIHVPMIVRWPGKVAPGRVDQTPIAFWDVLPTFAALSGAAPRSVPGLHTNGVSFAPLLTDAHATLAPRTLYWAFEPLPDEPGIAPTKSTRQAARRGKWMAVRYGETEPLQLYDIMADPGEKHDLATTKPTLATEFRTLFDGQLQQHKK